MQATVEALSEFDAEQAASVRGVLGLHVKEYRALARGQGLPEDMPKRTLMRLWVKRLLVDGVLWQYEAFSQAGLCNSGLIAPWILAMMLLMAHGLGQVCCLSCTAFCPLLY